MSLACPEGSLAAAGSAQRRSVNAASQISRVAQRTGRTPAQVLLRWCLQHDLLVIPKSAHRERIAENARIFDFALSGEDMAELNVLDQTKGTAHLLVSE
jgi:2,5-diketo-D-gluconate reductase A